MQKIQSEIIFQDLSTSFSEEIHKSDKFQRESSNIDEKVICQLRFQDFIDSLGKLKEQIIQIRDINQYLKIPGRKFPSFTFLMKHYKQEFITQTSSEKRKKWHLKDKQLLVFIILKYCQLHKKSLLNAIHKNYSKQFNDFDWENIGQMMHVSKDILKAKWLSLVKIQVKLLPWNKQEDNILLNLISQNNNEQTINWSQLATNLYSNSPFNIMRSAKQIRERWNNYLNPQLIKTQWSDAEDDQLFKLVQQLGKKWSQIARLINGRNECQVKNRYNSLTKKKDQVQQTTVVEQSQTPQNDLQESKAASLEEQDNNSDDKECIVQEEEIFNNDDSYSYIQNNDRQLYAQEPVQKNYYQITHYELDNIKQDKESDCASMVNNYSEKVEEEPIMQKENKHNLLPPNIELLIVNNDVEQINITLSEKINLNKKLPIKQTATTYCQTVNKQNETKQQSTYNQNIDQDFLDELEFEINKYDDLSCSGNGNGNQSSISTYHN